MTRKNKDKRTVKKRECKKRALSALEKQRVRKLAEQLGAIISLSGYHSTFSLTIIAKNKGLLKYLPKKNLNKKETFAFFLEKILCYKPRTLKPIVRDILPIAIEKRCLQGNPVLEAEAIDLSNTLKELGINLEKEINDLELPKERPRITPPPIKVVQSLKNIGLNVILLDKVLPMFENGHVNEAVHKAGELFEKEVLRYSENVGIYGRSLMSKVFNKERPEIDIKGYHQGEILNENDEREGYMYLAMGAVHWCKNIVGHGDVEQLSPQDAASRIILINHLIEVMETKFFSNKL